MTTPTCIENVPASFGGTVTCCNAATVCEECVARLIRVALGVFQMDVMEALEIAVAYGGIAGDHHKAWVIDQMVRKLAKDRYAKIVADACSGEDGPNTYTWDCGIAP